MLRRPQWPIRRPLTIQSGPLWCPGGPGVISLTRTKQWNSISKCHPLGNCGNGQSVIVIPLNRCQCLSSSENHWYPKESLSIQVIQLPRCRWMFLEWENPSRKSFNLERISSRRIFGFFFFCCFWGRNQRFFSRCTRFLFIFGFFERSFPRLLLLASLFVANGEQDVWHFIIGPGSWPCPSTALLKPIFLKSNLVSLLQSRSMQATDNP